MHPIPRRSPDVPEDTPAELISKRPHLAFLIEEGPQYPWLGVIADVVTRSA